MAQPVDLTRSTWTVEDVAELPDGARYEIIDGSLHVSPMASRLHHWIAGQIGGTLTAAAPPRWRVLREIGLALPGGTLAPDVTVLFPNADDESDPAQLTTPGHLAALVVEVESRTSRRMDRFTKPPMYAEAGIPCYWRVEQSDTGLIAHVYRLADGAYLLEQSVTEADSVETPLPYPVVVAPEAWAYLR